MADSKLEFDIVGHAESAVAAFGETAAAADGASKAVDGFTKKNKESSIAEQAAADRAAQGFARRFTSGIMMRLAGGGGGGGEGAGEASFIDAFGGQFGSLAAGALVAAPAIAAVVTEVDGLASGFVAAGAGMGAFYLLAHPLISNLTNDYAQVKSAQDALQTAQDKYQIDPTKTTLKAVQTAQLNLQAAQLGAKQDLGAAAPAVDKFAASLSNMQNAFQPTALKILGDAVGVLNDLLPTVLPLANAFADAFGGILKQADTAIKSKGFQEFFSKILADVGPATTAIGEGLGKVLPAIGRLFTVMSSHDVVHTINILFDTLAGFFNGMATWIAGAMRNWDNMSHDIAAWYQDTRKWLIRAQGDLANWAQDVDNFARRVRAVWHQASEDVRHWEDDVFHYGGEVINWFVTLPNRISDAMAHLGEMLFTAGQHAIQRLIDGIGSMFGSLGSMVGRVASKVAGFFGLSPAVEGPLSGGGAPEIRGAHFADALAAGVQSRLAVVGGSASALAGSLAGFGGRSLPAQAGGFGGSLGGLGPLQMQVMPGAGSALEQLLVMVMRQYVQVHGGGGPDSVQRALGQSA